MSRVICYRIEIANETSHKKGIVVTVPCPSDSEDLCQDVSCDNWEDVQSLLEGIDEGKFPKGGDPRPLGVKEGKKS